MGAKTPGYTPSLQQARKDADESMMVAPSPEPSYINPLSKEDSKALLEDDYDPDYDPEEEGNDLEVSEADDLEVASDLLLQTLSPPKGCV